MKGLACAALRRHHVRAAEPVAVDERHGGVDDVHCGRRATSRERSTAPGMLGNRNRGANSPVSSRQAVPSGWATQRPGRNAFAELPHTQHSVAGYGADSVWSVSGVMRSSPRRSTRHAGHGRPALAGGRALHGQPHPSDRHRVRLARGAHDLVLGAGNGVHQRHRCAAQVARRRCARGGDCWRAAGPHQPGHGVTQPPMTGQMARNLLEPARLRLSPALQHAEEGLRRHAERD